MDTHKIAYLVNQAGMPNPGVAGWPNGNVWWVATIMAESTGNSKAVNGTHYGLLQISAQHAGKHPAGSPADPEAYKQFLFAPMNNLNAGKSLFAVQGVGAWKASNFGRAKWKNKAEQGVALPVQPTLEEVVGGDVTGHDPLSDAIDLVSDPIEAVVNALDTARKWITDPSNLFRIAQVGGGIVLAIVAAAIVIKPLVNTDSISSNSGWQPVRGIST